MKQRRVVFQGKCGLREEEVLIIINVGGEFRLIPPGTHRLDDLKLVSQYVENLIRRSYRLNALDHGSPA